MRMKAIVNDSTCRIVSRALLTRGTVGKRMEAEFSADWEGLAITATFEAGDEKRDKVYTGEPIVIPDEVLTTAGVSVMLGFQGALPDGTIVKRTEKEWLNNVSETLDPAGVPSSEPTPDWTAQVQNIATEAKQVADSVRSDADAGKFNGQAGEAGGWYTPEVTQPDENTMRFSFTPSKEGMPAVPDKDISIPGGGGSGEAGGYYSPSVDADGNLSWTASKADMPAVDGANIKGPAGQKGDKGEKGDKGDKGDTGEPGGWYAPEVTQPDENTLRFAFAPSKEGMPAVPAIDIPIPGGGGDAPLRLIKTVTLEETVKTITIDADNDGNAFEVSEIYIQTNATNSEDQTAATSISFRFNGEGTDFIGTTSPMNILGGKTGESGRNWIWIISLNPLLALHGTWLTMNTSAGKTVQCYQANEFSDTNPNPYSVGEKITSIEILGAASTSYLAAGSGFRIYGR